MTVHQNTPAAETPPGFGDIPINRAPQTLAGKPARSKRQPSRAPRKKSPFILLLALISATILLYFAAVLLLVPMLVKGPVSTKIGNRLNRPVQVESVSLSPFNFRFHLAGINIGSAPDRKGDIPLCTLAAIDGQLLLKSLLQGKVVLANLRITRPDATIIRSAESSVFEFFQSSAENSTDTILPSWLLVQGIQLTEGTLNFQDQPSSRQYNIKQIQFNLPTGNKVRNSTEPTLTAMMNSSPVLLRGRSHTNSDGTAETRLTLQLKQLDLTQLVTFLPNSLRNLNLSSDNADADLEIILKNTLSAGMNIIVSGTLNAANLAIEGQDQGFTLKVPTMQMLFKARPLERHYSISSLTAVAPQLTLAGRKSVGLTTIQTMLNIFLHSSAIGLTVDQLKVDQGALETADHTRWHDLRLLLTNLRNTAAGHSEQPTGLTLQANHEQSTAAFQGEITPAGTLAGKFSLHNIGANQLQPFQPDTKAVRFEQGLLQLEGTLVSPQDKPGQTKWEITDTTLQISNFSLHNKDILLATGAEMTGSGCLLQSGRPDIKCQQLSFQQTDFTPAALALLTPADRGSNGDYLAFDTLDINNSTAEFFLPGENRESKNMPLRLTSLQLNRTGMQQANPGSENLRLKAVLGEQGKIEITGKLQGNGQDTLQISASNIDINILPATLFSSWLTPEVRQGTLQIDGRLILPDIRFAGSLQINDFTAGRDSGPFLHWQQAAVSEITARLTPFSATVNRLVLDQPSITLPRSKKKLPADLLTLLKTDNGEPILPLLSISECVVNNGTLTSPGHVTLTTIEGSIAPLQRNTPAEFTLDGQMNDTTWTATGRTGLKSGAHTLQISNSPFSPAAKALFTDSFQLTAGEATADLTVSTTDPGAIRMTGITPLPDSEFALLLALLTDQSNTVNLQLPALDDTSPANVLTKAVPLQLGRLRLQAAVSPLLILDSRLPELNLPRTVEFLPGETVPDFMEELEDYPALLALRPQLVLAVRGNYDDTTDRYSLVQVLQEEADALRSLENIHREQRRAQLTAEKQQLTSRKDPPPGTKLRLQEQLAELQPLPPTVVHLPDAPLLNLGRQRAEVLNDYLINTLHIPPEKVKILPPTDGGSQAELILQPGWLPGR